MAAIMSANVSNSLSVVVATVVVYLVLKFARNAFWEPVRLRRIMAKQGIGGPPFRFLLGYVMETVKISQSFPDKLPMNDYANLSPTVTPQYVAYFPKYGKMFVYRWGSLTRLVVRDPEIVKELIITNHESLTRSELHQIFSVVVGKGLLSLGGEKWILERRTISPFFHHDALKAMVEAMVKGAAPEIQKWENMVADGGGEAEIDVEPDLHKISGRIISRTAFGDDFKIGEQIFKFQTLIAQQLLKTLRSRAYWLVPGYRRIPTKGNRLMDHYSSEVDALLRGLISDRRQMDSFVNDLLGRMLAAASEGWNESTQEFNLASVFNNCKLFYFAGQDTVANAICFTLLMLAYHPEWQDRTRKEVREVFDGTAAALPHLKLVLFLDLRLIHLLGAQQFGTFAAGGDGIQRNTATLSTGYFGYESSNERCATKRGAVHTKGHSYRICDFSDSSRQRVLGRRCWRVQSRKICQRCVGSMFAQASVFPIWPGPEVLHREQLGSDGSEDGVGHRASTIPIAAIAKLQASSYLGAGAKAQVWYAHYFQSSVKFDPLG